MKLCLINNFAQHYRTSIFCRIDEEFDCDFYFGDWTGGIKLMDYSLLKGPVRQVHTRRLGGGWYYQSGIPFLLWKKYDTYILFAESRGLSTWLFLLLAKFFPRKRVILWSHGWYGKETPGEARMKRGMFRLPNGGTLLYGNYARDLMIREGLDPDKLYVIHNSLAYSKQVEVRKGLAPNPVYADRFGNTDPNLIFVGRLTEVKKLDQILKAMAASRDKGHSYNLTLIGGGVKEMSLRQCAEELGLQDRVWFYGPCYDENTIGEMMFNADLCVSPGNVGLTAMHAMVFGTPVVTHDDFPHQMPEFEAIHDGVTGKFFKAGDVESLSATVDAWFASSPDREKVRQDCMAEIDAFWTPDFQMEVLKKVLYEKSR